jgi:putative ABC transport system permease protein
MESLIKDIRYGFRTLVSRPGFSAVVILTLALGIGANTALFSVVDAVLLEPLPYSEPDRLVRLWSAYPERDIEQGTTSPLDLDDWRAQSTAFDSMAGFPNIRLRGFVLTGGESPEEIETVFVTEGFFETLGVVAELGRTIAPADHVEGNNRVVVLSHGAWQRRFGADPGLVGSTITLSGSPFTVIGVMPASFEYPYADAEMWAPLSLIPDSGVPRRRFIRWLSVVARLAPGASLEQAQAEMTTIAARLEQEYPEANEGLTAVTIRPLHEQLVGDVQTAMLTVFAAVGFVLLIGCANIANLLLARSEGRSKEIAVRVALGAGRGRLIRQLLTESVMLAIGGGALGLALSVWGVRALVAMAPEEIPRLSSVGIDGNVLAFTAAVALLTGLAFGIVPALRAAAADPHDTLKEGVRGSSAGGGRHAFRAFLVTAEVALVVVLAIGAGLLIRTYGRLLQVDPGIDASNLLTLSVTAQSYKYPETEQYVAHFEEIIAAVREAPGVESAAMVRPMPLRADTFSGESFSFSIPGKPEMPEGEERRASLRFASPGYFKTMGIPMLAGRDFTPRDNRESPFVLVINQTAAERYWPGEDPVGQTVKLGDSEAEIIGVVGDVRQLSLAQEPAPAVYSAFTQVSRVGMTLVVRTTGEPLNTLATVQSTIWDIDPDQPISQISTMDQLVLGSVAQPRFSMTLLSVFAGLALVLASVGIYGVISYSVSQRTHELGLRMALGAETGDLLKLILRQGLALAGTGIGIGLLAALVLTRLMESLLFGVAAVDLVTFAFVCVLLGLVALVATTVPAFRAARVDPMISLRAE